ncbi:hypothetical protein B1759_01515 [Rubrivirga sp. SAORIC476]|uniref:hypothetical protein n=1 Tax=Rubrivirga sp. SAORIC476 TaxID=1961794 RepID=UPI000BA8D48D|nr:hypothetical protein [Rubrivirga sp. SAORIC476]PAP82456.1 hypothetical protein B1759_01515 [Rubrivirga sp. SAORIC476]
MASTLRLCLLALLVAGGVDAQTPDAPPSSPYDTVTGDVALALSGGLLDFSAEARYWVSDGLSVGVALDRQPFTSDAPIGLYGETIDGGRDARTVSLSVETGGMIAPERVFYATGLQAFARRQTDDLLVGHADPEFSTPVVDEDGRQIDALGLGVLTRVELRTVGPLYLGSVTSLGLNVERTRGADVNGNVIVDLPEGEQRTRLRFGGPIRVYLGVRL